MSGGGVLGIGVSALLAAQRALQVTGHNIANVNTEGYSRQRLDLAARAPQTAGFAAIGSGVELDGVERVVDQFVNLRLGMRTSAEAHQRTLAEFAGQVNNLLGDAESGLASAMQQFFAAVQDVGNDPTSTAARQALIAQGQSLADRFRQLDARLEDQSAIVTGRIGASVTEINELAAGIAELNRAIVDAQGRGGGVPPNDLLDKRDELLRKLSERVSVDTVEQSDGSLNVYVGKGQALVVGYDATRLQLRSQTGESNAVAIGYDHGAGFVDVTSLLRGGGEVGALLEVRDEFIDPATRDLGRIALSLATRFNAQHGLNMDLDGALGGDFFSIDLPPAAAGEGNAASGEPQVAVNDVSALAATDYSLRFDGTDWTLRRLSDGQDVGTLPNGGSLDVDGLTFDLGGVTGAAAGDSFLLRPIRVAGGIGVRVTDPRAVAAALPIRAEAAVPNAGGAAVHSIEVLDASDPALGSSVDIVFTGGSYVVGGNVVPLDPSGDTVVGANGWQLVLRGTPAEGDVFEVRTNAGGIGDNRGALALAALETERVMTGGSASFGESYAELVAGVGVRTRRAEINADVEARMLEDARAQRENVSGVNLDEEAANLLRHQQAYQAAAQVIATAGNMLDSLLQTLRR
ncbi:MAG: flagellar hook-associated protein FlgK [Gammaproteobacteria bacterium]|nr:flagellar hook-associated protein FlgK [Gammaproteobacteria bacterium]